MNKKTVKDIDLKGKRVFMRVDFNVPMDEHHNITDDIRIRTALPTIKYVLENKGKLILCSHMGRPKGKRVEAFSLDRLHKLTRREVFSFSIARRLLERFEGKLVTKVSARLLGVELGDSVLTEIGYFVD